MSQPPIRTTLHHQLVALLRQGIENDRWSGGMPCEAELGREFQVSRMTLRKALAQLAAEEWIALGGRGSTHRVLRRPRTKKKLAVPTARTIRILTPFGFSGWNTTAFELLETLSERISAAGYRVEMEHHRAVFEKFQASKLARLDALPDTAAWLLFYSTAPIQRWFAASGRPTMVVGRIHEAIPLSCIYPDTEAAARHAAGRLYSCGHREMIYLIENLTSLGDRMASEVFVAEARRLGARARIVNYDGDPPSIRKTVMDLMASRPRATAYLTGSPGIAITVLCHLLSAGIRVPTDAAVIALWDDVDLDVTFPTIARYRTDGKVMGRKIGHKIIDLIRHGPGKVRAMPMVPEFVAGESIGR
ncbi:MAG: substrate-binding domain-containing protein [Verrucomicrobiota bacterium]